MLPNAAKLSSSKLQNPIGRYPRLVGNVEKG